MIGYDFHRLPSEVYESQSYRQIRINAALMTWHRRLQNTSQEETPEQKAMREFMEYGDMY